MIYTDYLESRKNKNKKLTYNLQIPNALYYYSQSHPFHDIKYTGYGFSAFLSEDTHVF
jgi:hypothetical protein